ncbi:cytochrome C [Sulfurimonas sp. CS5]|jgi:Spy/CpxP family protein refolding chaperone|uniref:cytochrome C n=1 Tax=Sulfurimonas sp. CS5 TaxID=3391145 RepID=UPI0039EAAAB8
MNKIVKIALAAMLMLSMSSVALSADVAKGQKLYLKKLKGSCNMNGAKMASKHSQAEWQTLKENGKLADELKNICPGVKDKALKGKYLPHYFDFFFEYANDSGNVPSC